jgi:hypothetical protein
MFLGTWSRVHGAAGADEKQLSIAGRKLQVMMFDAMCPEAHAMLNDVHDKDTVSHTYEAFCEVIRPVSACGSGIMDK